MTKFDPGTWNLLCRQLTAIATPLHAQ